MGIRKWFNYWISEDRSVFFWSLAAVFGLTYLFGVALSEYNEPVLAARCRLIGFIGAMILAVVVLIHKNLHSYYVFLDMFRDTDHLPQKQISYVNSFCMTVFLIATVIGILVLVFALDPLWQLIGGLTASKAPARIQTPPMPELTTPPPSPVPDMQLITGEIEPTPEWVKYVNSIVEKVVFLFTVVGLLYLIRQAAKGIWGYMMRPREFDEDEKIYLKPNLSIDLLSKTQGLEEKKESGVRHFMSFTSRIRRRYKKEILDGRKKVKNPSSPPEWASPEELELSAAVENETLHQIYEKARYSGQECTESDWKKLEQPLPAAEK